MELTLERGRWASARIGRVYINDGVAKETVMKLSQMLKYQLAIKAEAFTSRISQEGESRLRLRRLKRGSFSAG